MAKRPLRKGLSAPGLLCEVRACFEAVDDPVQGRGLSLAECLMSGLGGWRKYSFHMGWWVDAAPFSIVDGNLLLA